MIRRAEAYIKQTQAESDAKAQRNHNEMMSVLMKIMLTRDITTEPEPLAAVAELL